MKGWIRITGCLQFLWITADLFPPILYSLEFTATTAVTISLSLSGAMNLLLRPSPSLHLPTHLHRATSINHHSLGLKIKTSHINLTLSRLPARSRFHLTRASADPVLGGGGEGEGEGVGKGRVSVRDLVVRIGEVLSLGFPFWVGSACALALWRPPAFLWVGRGAQIVGITLTMLGMGMTLTLEDLRSALLMPKELAAGFVLQYTIMPLSGFFISKLLNLPSHYAAGLILVACCPGGTASNIVTYLAKGNVALSVLMTAASTFAAAVMTPFLTSKLAGQFVAVDPKGLFMSTVQVVLAPVLAGALLNQYCNSLVHIVSPLMPFVAVATVALLCGSAIAQNAAAILSSGSLVVTAACCLHASGFFFGYILARILGIDDSSSRTISIEVGMQNSVLGVVLATEHFGNPLTAVPCAVSSICHSVFGSILAGIWRSMPPKTMKKD